MKLILILFIVFLSDAQAIAPILNRDNAQVVPDSYIVVLKSGISNAAVTSHLSWVDSILKSKQPASKSTFDLNGFKGYNIKAPKAIADVLAKSDEVDYIEADQAFTVSPPLPSTSSKLSSRNVQANAPWGLARISHRMRGSTDYVFSPSTGTYIYVLDTGVRVTHTLFGGRASFGFNAVGGSNDDTNGHGTHIAGIASSQTYGVVRFAHIISVKILGDDGSTTTSIVISGINWAVQDMTNKGRVGKATALITIGGGYSAALNNAIAAGSNAGLFFAVAAGMENSGSSNSSPQSEPTACVVGGTTIDDAKMSTSNYGPGIDIFAPGQQIPSLWITGSTSTMVLSGTSQAAAHIAGLGAYFLALEGPRTPVALCQRLREVATPNALSGIPAGTANLLAYNLSGL